LQDHFQPLDNYQQTRENDRDIAFILQNWDCPRLNLLVVISKLVFIYLKSSWRIEPVETFLDVEID